MRCQLFGQTGLRVSELFLGAMTFGEQGGVGAPLEECRRMVDAYADAGGNVIDTASNYRGGLSETIVGELLEGRRGRFVLATKYTLSRDQSEPNGAGNHRKNLVLSLETSLRRLRTDYIDVYWVHVWDVRTPVERRCVPSTTRSGPAGCSTSASPTPRPGSWPGLTRSPSGRMDTSPGSRFHTVSSSATSNATCCPWPRPSA
jgi:aryl-alcohol dehydrogenase-like predicted oxidoreductase